MCMYQCVGTVCIIGNLFFRDTGRKPPSDSVAVITHLNPSSKPESFKTTPERETRNWMNIVPTILPRPVEYQAHV